MNVTELLEKLTLQGVQLSADNDKLRIHSPKGILTPEIRAALAERKTEILKFLRGNNEADNNIPNGQDLSIQTIGRLIGGFCNQAIVDFKPPIVDPKVMAKKLKVTFRPLPKGYQEEKILKFREELELKLRNYGVQIETWEQATKEFCYEINIPLTKWKKSINTRVVRAGISAVIDVERHPSLLDKIKIFIAEKIYQFYSHFILKNREISASKITQFISWAEDHAIQRLEDPTNTQVIVITELDSKYTNQQIPYEQRIPIGLRILVGTLSEIVIGVSSSHISILNMNLSDSTFPVEEMDDFVFRSLIPKIYVPILPLPMSRFEIGEYDPNQSGYAAKLAKLSKEMALTGLLPAGWKINDVIRRKSHRDITNWIANGRTGVSYGFIAYAEAPQYVGEIEISEREWESLSSVEGFSSDELRQNKIGRRYIKTKIGKEYTFKQIPDIWLVSSRSGSNKTDLNLETDILRIGLKDRLCLHLPLGTEPNVGDIKPSYDLYVMVAIALAAALYAPELIKNGAPMVHFHGYPSIKWFESKREYCTGVLNPSVPCGTYESGVFNFLGIYNIVNQHGSDIALASLIEPDHGTNVIAYDLEYLVTRLKSGIDQGQVELGGKYFPSLKQSVAAN